MNELDASNIEKTEISEMKILQKDNDVHSYNAIVNNCNLINDSEYDHSKAFTLFLK